MSNRVVPLRLCGHHESPEGQVVLPAVHGGHEAQGKEGSATGTQEQMTRKEEEEEEKEREGKGLPLIQWSRFGLIQRTR